MRKVMSKKDRLMVKHRFQRRQRARGVKKVPLCSDWSDELLDFPYMKKQSGVPWSLQNVLPDQNHY